MTDEIVFHHEARWCVCVLPVRLTFQRQQVCGVALERAAKDLPICFAHIPSDDQGRCDLDRHSSHDANTGPTRESASAASVRYLA